jgi:hypothetical protein
MSEIENACCYRCALRDKCPHPEVFFCNLIDLKTCDGKRQCNPCPEFKERQEVVQP